MSRLISRTLGLWILTLGILSPLFSADEPSPAFFKTEHYTVTCTYGMESAQEVGALMEALVYRYNELFLFDLSKRPLPFNVVLYATKDEFQKGLKGKFPSAGYQDFVFLNFADPSSNLLAGWKKDDMNTQLAFQGFYQFLWSAVPHPPAWVETGLAYYFWDSTWDGKNLKENTTLPLLDTVEKLWKERPLNLEKLLTATEAPDGALADGQDAESWALVTFLLKSPDPAYTRLLGNILANLDPQASAAENTQRALAKLQSLKPLAEVAKDCRDFWSTKSSFAMLQAQALAQIQAKDFTHAQETLAQARAMKDDFSIFYTSGLVCYELKDYAQADKFYVQAASAPGASKPGLIAFARGLAAFGLKDWEKTKTFLNQAIKENPGEFTKAAQPVLDLLK